MGYIPWEYLHLLTCCFNIRCRNKTSLMMTSSSFLNFRHQENQDSETLKMFVLTFVGVWEVQSPQHGITLHIKPSTGSAPPALSIWTARHLVFLFHIWWGRFHREEVFGILELVVPGRISEGGSRVRANLWTQGWLTSLFGRNKHNAVKQLSSKNRKTSLVVNIFLLFCTIYS